MYKPWICKTVTTMLSLHTPQQFLVHLQRAPAVSAHHGSGEENCSQHPHPNANEVHMIHLLGGH